MINLMNEHELTEMEIEREGQKIKLKKASLGASAVVTHAPPTYQPPPEASEKAAAPSGGSANPNAKEINSPMVGTFYRSPSPESPPPVEFCSNKAFTLRLAVTFEKLLSQPVKEYPVGADTVGAVAEVPLATV